MRNKVRHKIRSDTWGKDKRKRYFVSIARGDIAELGWQVGDRLYLAKYGQFPTSSQMWPENVSGDTGGVPLTLRYRQGTFYIVLPRALVDYFQLETGQEVTFQVAHMGYEKGKRLLFTVNRIEG